MMNWFSLNWFSPDTLRAFEWARPYYFWLLLLIPLLFFLKWVFKSHRLPKLILSISEISIQSSIFVWMRYLVPLFFMLGLINLIFALARPQLEDQSTEKYAEGIDIALAVDVSESMLANDLQPNRLEAAKKIAVDFVSGRSNDRIALVAFAGETTTLSPLTTDYDQLRDELSKLNTNLVKTSGTAIGLALASSINKLRDVPGKSKVTIIISDGDNTTGSIDPAIALELAKTFGIRIYTIAIGKDGTSEKIDEKTLKMLANNGNGQFFRATDNRTLGRIFEQINTLEKSRFKDQGIKNVSDYYYIYLNWAILFLLISLLLKHTFLGNILED
ncbi:MAG: VWA domain-containing protein [Cytophagaceae bacterium]|nr:VWA domain-containing protein [Cytophagaceae bacterium]